MSNTHHINGSHERVIFTLDPEDPATNIQARLGADNNGNVFLELRTEHRILVETTGGVNAINVRAESPVTTALARQAADRIGRMLNEIHRGAAGTRVVDIETDLDALVRFAQDNAR
jgi:hypothetical protein